MVFWYFNSFRFVKRLKKSQLRSAVLAYAGVVSLCAPASAQIASPSDLPGSADPGRVIEDLSLPERPDESLRSEEPARRAVPIVPEGMEQLRFTLRSVSFDGMSAYDDASVAPLYQSYIGSEISVATLFEIMGRIQQKYLDDGYALTRVTIPNQNIEEGRVILTVVEGYVGHVDIAEGVLRSPAVMDAANVIAAMRPLNIKRLERIMLLLNDLPDGGVSAILASAKAPAPEGVSGSGAVRLVLQDIGRSERIGGFGIDNHGSVFTGPYQIRADARAASFGFEHSELAVSALAAAPVREQKVMSGSYTVPLFGISGAQLSLGASRALTEPGSSLSRLDIKGASDSVEAMITYPVIRQRDMTLRIEGGVEWKNSRTKIVGEELYDDRLRIAKAGVNFNFTDRWAGYNVLDARYSQGMDVLGARESGSVDLSREDGRSDFKKMTAVAARIQGLPWGLELLGVVQGQYALDPLLSSEEFGFGGAHIGRGYDSSEITGDRGVAASVEFRYRTQMEAFNTVLSLQPYAFYDVGKVWNIDKDAKSKMSAASAGMGIRLGADSGWKADFNLAVPLTRPADNEPKYQNGLGGRLLFSVSKSF